ncbi:hypothetical protein K7X08_029372 [Anisodus acutangulus]|uniref:Uncharacterized protein n=1 Tax=Anisodus acutangulus TaxID=402998 RepID=A0A9Q1QVW5_9SOLA|nr:hypothetical protein K7X08_029372 [Anisodus acutangulus]
MTFSKTRPSWAKRRGNVKSSNNRNVLEIQVSKLVQGILSQGVWQFILSFAFYDFTTVTGLTPTSTTTIEVAISTTPYTCHFSTQRRPKPPALTLLDPPATAYRGCPPRLCMDSCCGPQIRRKHKCKSQRQGGGTLNKLSNDLF